MTLEAPRPGTFIASSERPGVIIVSPYFPPSTLAGVHRARYLAKWLPTAGWRPIIVCVDEAYHEEALDPTLAELVPRGVEIRRVRALPTTVTRLAGVGDISIRGWLSLRRAVLSLAEQDNIKAAIITGAPFYSMLLAPLLARRLKIPVVLDFQDPWVSAWSARRPAFSKGGVFHRLGTVLEPRALRAAAHVTTVSRRQHEDLLGRYPWLEKTPMTDIPIGADPDDFLAVREPGVRTNGNVGRRFTIAYVGTIWPPVIPTLRAFLRALARLRSQDEVYSRLQVLFVGTSGIPGGNRTNVVQPLAEQEGVADIIKEIPQRLPYLDALTVTANADLNLILGSDEPHYTASKVYGILMAGRPHLSILRPESSAHSVCQSAGGGIALTFKSHDHIDEIVPTIADSITQAVKSPESLGTISPDAYAPYEASAIAARFAEILDRLSYPHTMSRT